MRLPLVTWKELITGKCQSPALLLTIGRGFLCIFPEDGLQSIWIPAWLTRPLTAETSSEADEIGQLQETVANTSPAHVFTYRADSE